MRNPIINCRREPLRWSALALGLITCLAGTQAVAHEWHDHNQTTQRTADRNNEPNGVRLVTVMAQPPAIATHFQHFNHVKVRWDQTHLYVESNGLPEHGMMVGIKAWQQQVPLPQPFTGSNSWKIPLKPRLAKSPINAKQTPFRGAIALAVNGVPIFSALNNRGEDAYLAGELDKWGGHCGRGDDYHYHIAPIHLEKTVGTGNPIAFALDGFPIYGMTESDGSPVGKLDALNGQFDEAGNYHYHSTKSYPYINGGVRGVVDYRNGEIASQPRDAPVRPGQPPLRGATITGFKTNGSVSTLVYKINGRQGTIVYQPTGVNSFKFTYSEPDGRRWTETYERRQRPGGPNERNGNRPPPPGPRPRR